jgi:hypothetical protein
VYTSGFHTLTGNSDILTKELFFCKVAYTRYDVTCFMDWTILPRKWQFYFNERNFFHSYLFPFIYYLLLVYFPIPFIATFAVCIDCCCPGVVTVPDSFVN